MYTQKEIDKMREYHSNNDLFCEVLDELERLIPFEQQVNDIQEVINEEEPLKFVDAEIKSGTVIDALIHGALARVIVGALVRLFIDSKCENYLEIEMQKTMIDQKKDPEWYTIVIQKKTGMTPAQKATKYENVLKSIKDTASGVPYVMSAYLVEETNKVLLEGK